MTGLRNCHAHGVDSIVLSTYPDGRPHVRVLVTRPDHTLWRNTGALGFASVAVHAHRADLMLKQIYGPVFNIRASVLNGGLDQDRFDSWSYSSALLGAANPGFAIRGSVYLSTNRIDMRQRRVEFVDAGKLHTIFVPQGSEAAWFVVENAIADTYKDTVYSNADLAAFSFDGMYEPMSEDDCNANLLAILERTGRQS